MPNCQIRKEKKTIEGFRLDNDCLATAAEVRGRKGAKINWQLATIAKLPNKNREKTIEGFRLDNDCLATALEVRGRKRARN